MKNAVLPPWAATIEETGVASNENPAIQFLSQIFHRVWDEVNSFIGTEDGSTKRDVVSDEFILQIGLDLCKQLGLKFIEPW